jgi:uncharacterized repeat protein (TIGR01451 family)
MFTVASKKTKSCILVVILVLGAIGLSSHVIVRSVQTSGKPQAIQAPVLKWQHGGCTSWCETGWYSSPAVADLDDDGTVEVIGGAYTLFALNGEDGSIQWSVDTVGNRIWPGVVVADIDNSGDLEVAIAQHGGYLYVFDHTGGTVWSRRPTPGYELRGLSAYDLDDDGTLELIVTGGVHNNPVTTWVYEHNGDVRTGWPQLSTEAGYAAGVYNDNAAVGDIDDDGMGEIIVPTDVHYICGYEANGAQIPANAIYGSKAWSQVGVWENYDTELIGWAYCSGGREERYRTNFAHGPASIADVNGDGTVEVVAVGNVYDCAVGHPPGKYMGVYVFNADRSRFNSGGHDWRTPPIDTGAPLSEDWTVILDAMPNPALADLDGDGELEILYASYDGRVHVFWLDGTEHHNWPYAVYTGGGYRFASEPAVADLDNDGTAEVVFGSWVQNGSNQTGKLHILNYQGNVLHEIDLPLALNGDWNGALAAPTLANIDTDADLEVVLNTAQSGLLAYDLPSTANAHVLWGTGRGNYQRTGSLSPSSLKSSRVGATPILPGPGDAVTYTISLHNPGAALPSVRVTSTLPTEVKYLGNLWASAGSYGEAGGTITWTGIVSTAIPVTITYGVTVSEQITMPHVIRTTVWIDDGQGTVWQRPATVVANGFATYLPLIFRAR